MKNLAGKLQVVIVVKLVAKNNFIENYFLPTTSNGVDEEIKDLLRQNLEVSEKSLVILKKMRKEMIWGRIFHLAKWAVVAGFMIFVFIKIQPHVVYWTEIFTNISTNIEKFNNIFPRGTEQY